jgi:hypothetical protein
VVVGWRSNESKKNGLADPTRLKPFDSHHKEMEAATAPMAFLAHMFKNGTLSQDLGANHFDKRAQGKHVLQLVNRLKHLGFAVQITPVAA